MLMAEQVLQVGKCSWLHPHGPGMDVAAKEQQTAQPSPGWNTSMGLAMGFCTGTKQQLQESGGKRGLRENLKAEEIWKKWTRQEMKTWA